MRGLFPIVLALGFPAMALAAPVVVRTGEHDSFSRVVVTLGPDMPWSLGRNDVGYQLRLPVVDGYAVERFFDLIPQSRITAVSQDIEKGELTLAIGCPCRAEAFVFRDRFLVIDIRDGLPAPLSPFEKPLPDLSPNGGETGGQRSVSPAQLASRRVLPLIFDGRTERQTAEVTVPSAQPVNVQALAPVQDGTSTDLQELEESILQSLGAAMTEGLLMPGTLPPSDTPPPRSDDIATTAPGVLVRTSRQDLPVPSSQETPSNCPQPEAFDIASWADARPFSEQLRYAQARAFQDDQAIDQNGILDLARLYLHFGFGLEARHALMLDGARSQQREWLMELALILDDLARDRSALAAFAGCETEVALWALLADETEPLEVNTAAILQNYKGLPRHLQTLVASRLAERFVQIGDLEGAQQVLDRTTPAAEAKPDLALAQSTFALARAQPDQALETVLGPIIEGENVTPQLLTRALDLGTDQVTDLDPRVAQLADAMRFESGRTDAAQSLAASQLGYHLALGQFDLAEEVLRDLIRRGDRADTYAVLFAETAVATMPDPAFGRYAWDDTLLPADAAARQTIAARLKVMGFPERALTLTGVTANRAAVIAPNPAPAAVPRPESQTQDSGQSGQLRDSVPVSASTITLERASTLLATTQRVRTELDKALEQTVVPD